MKEKSVSNKPQDQPSNKIRFHYVKSNQFRVIHVDGIYGGPTPKAGIQIAFFNERQPIPQEQVFEINTKTGALINELKEDRVSKDGVIREVEVNAVMDLQTAKSLCKWLEEKVKAIESFEKNPLFNTSVATKAVRGKLR